jgi:hypothetical protein
MSAYIAKCTADTITVVYTAPFKAPRLQVTKIGDKVASAQLIQTAPLGPVVIATPGIKEQP